MIYIDADNNISGERAGSREFTDDSTKYFCLLTYPPALYKSLSYGELEELVADGYGARIIRRYSNGKQHTYIRGRDAARSHKEAA